MTILSGSQPEQGIETVTEFIETLTYNDLGISLDYFNLWIDLIYNQQNTIASTTFPNFLTEEYKQFAFQRFHNEQLVAHLLLIKNHDFFQRLVSLHPPTRILTIIHDKPDANKTFTTKLFGTPGIPHFDFGIEPLVNKRETGLYLFGVVNAVFRSTETSYNDLLLGVVKKADNPEEGEMNLIKHLNKQLNFFVSQ